jgi:hypothetical protein
MAGDASSLDASSAIEIGATTLATRPHIIVRKVVEHEHAARAFAL